MSIGLEDLSVPKEWKPRAGEFQKWLRVYKNFREAEDVRLYRSEGPEPLDLEIHRKALTMLLFQGENLSEGLSDAERKELGILMQSLRESLQLWHPANPVPESTKAVLRAAFGFDEA